MNIRLICEHEELSGSKSKRIEWRDREGERETENGGKTEREEVNVHEICFITIRSKQVIFEGCIYQCFSKMNYAIIIKIGFNIRLDSNINSIYIVINAYF